jgi:predicted transcriptional regulator of viral defense system
MRAGAVRLVAPLGALAAEQWGLFTTAQAVQVGVSSQQLARLAGQGVVERVRHGVYRVAGAPPGVRDHMRAAWLALRPAQTVEQRLASGVGSEPDGVEVVSHRSASVLHGLGDLDADRTEFTVATRRQSRDRDVRFHLATLAPGEWTVLDGLPVTTVERTLVDLARGHLDGGHLAGVVRDAVTTLHLDPGVVARVLAPFAHRYGAAPHDGQGLVRQFLEEAGIPAATRAAAAMVVPEAIAGGGQR